MDSIKEYFGEPISTYTCKQAEEDGILFNASKLNPAWEKGLFNYITTNLLNKGYMEEDKGDSRIRMPNIVDLLNQANQIVKHKSKNYTEADTFFSGDIELPSGSKQQIFIQQNETGKFTIMLPEDY